MRFRKVGDFPAIEHPFDDFVRHPAFALPILGEEPPLLLGRAEAMLRLVMAIPALGEEATERFPQALYGRLGVASFTPSPELAGRSCRTTSHSRPR